MVLGGGNGVKGKWRRAKGGVGTEDFTHDDGCMTQCADDVLLGCTLETCIVL